MLLALVASMWAVVITIPLIVRWRDSRHVQSVGNFSRSLGVLGHRCSTMTAIPVRQNVRKSSWSVLTKFGRIEPEVLLEHQYGSSVPQSGKIRQYRTGVSRLARQRMLRRRKNILFSLLSATAFFFIVNLLRSSRLVELLTLLSLLALIAYLGLLVQLKKAVFN